MTPDGYINNKQLSPQIDNISGGEGIHKTDLAETLETKEIQAWFYFEVFTGTSKKPQAQILTASTLKKRLQDLGTYHLDGSDKQILQSPRIVYVYSSDGYKENKAPNGRMRFDGNYGTFFVEPNDKLIERLRYHGLNMIRGDGQLITMRGNDSGASNTRKLSKL